MQVQLRVGVHLQIMMCVCAVESDGKYRRDDSGSGSDEDTSPRIGARGSPRRW